MNELFSGDAIVAEAVPARVCEHCQTQLEPRQHGGGKPKRFCSEECRRAWHSNGRGFPNAPNAHSLEDVGLSPTPSNQSRVVEPPQAEADEFDWSGDDVLLREQRAIAVYRNPAGNVVIRQERSWDETDDPFMVITSENLQAFIDRLCDLAGIGGMP